MVILEVVAQQGLGANLKQPENLTQGVILVLVTHIQAKVHLAVQILQVVHRIKMKSKLYYEAHVTVEPVFEEQYQLLKKISEQYNFRIADLLMKKRDSDTPERSKYDTSMTGHGTDLDDMKGRLTMLITKARQ